MNIYVHYKSTISKWTSYDTIGSDLFGLEFTNAKCVISIYQG